MTRRALLAALIVGLAAFALYRSTLLPGGDFGDTGSFQATIDSPLITPRDGYPLYFAIGSLAMRLNGAEPAHTLNLVSAIEGAAACGLLVLVAAELSGSVLAGTAAALLFAVSFTFWSQAIIAEVYALHAALLALTLWLLLRWQRQPTDTRLFAFFAVFAVGFGNHLSMVLLIPGYTLFLLMAAPRGWRSMFSPRIVAVALACAIVGAMQYSWNLRTLWLLPDPPHRLVDGLQRFWFDVTKSDWRDTMVMQVPQSMLGDHLAMYWFDLRQQFGIAGPLLAVAGLVQLATVDRQRALLMVTLFAANLAFAYSYNVGDAHVFYLPSHLILALMAAPAVAGAARVAHDLVPRDVAHDFSRAIQPIAAFVLIAYSGTRAYHDFPALDRSGDTRPTAIVDALTRGLDDRHNILLEDVNWQIGNGLSYFIKVKRPEMVAARMADVLLYAPAVAADNRAIGRDVALTERAREKLVAAYGPLLPVIQDPRVPVQTWSDSVRTVPAGTRYVLCVLKPSADASLDLATVASALQTLTGKATPLPSANYVVVAGVIGSAPEILIAADRPFSRHVDVHQVAVDIRMDGWLPSDTIRRMGFGQVIVARRHTLIVERGISFAAFDENGRAIRTEYASNIYAPQARYLIDNR